MKPNELDKLVEKYFAGETSLEEEKWLLIEIQKMESPEDYEEILHQIQALHSISEENFLGDSFDEALFEKIKKSETSSPTLSRKIWGYRFSGVAAAILLFIAIWFGSELFQPKEVYGTITDPELAFNETRKVFDTIAVKMNKGIKPVKKSVGDLDENLSKTEKVKKINQSLKKMKKLEELDKASELFKSLNKVSVTYGNS